MTLSQNYHFMNRSFWISVIIIRKKLQIFILCIFIIRISIRPCMSAYLEMGFRFCTEIPSSEKFPFLRKEGVSINNLSSPTPPPTTPPTPSSTSPHAPHDNVYWRQREEVVLIFWKRLTPPESEWNEWMSNNKMGYHVLTGTKVHLLYSISLYYIILLTWKGK